MRIRTRKWTKEELDSSVFFVPRQEETKNRWNEIFGIDREEYLNKKLHLEIGMGKGKFISNLGNTYLNNKEEATRKDNIFVGVDLVQTMLGLAKREVENVYMGITKEQRDSIFMNRDGSYTNEELRRKVLDFNIVENYPNIRLLDADAENIEKYFGEEDNVSRIYLNFSNPWPKDRHNKRRLTHNTKLKKYLEFLVNEGEIFFKTDDLEFFEESREYFKEEGFEEIVYTHNLKEEDIFLKYSGIANIETEHEKMFMDQGININAAIYKRKQRSKDEKKAETSKSS